MTHVTVQYDMTHSTQSHTEQHNILLILLCSVVFAVKKKSCHCIEKILLKLRNYLVQLNEISFLFFYTCLTLINAGFLVS